MIVGNPDGVYATVIADSVSPTGDRVTTMEVQCHRFVLAEFNTHRVFSRNSASSRAIPLAKQIERVTTNPAVPLVFPAEQKGMQGGDEVEQRDVAAILWRDAADSAVTWARTLGSLGVHKSVANRILEPFMWHKIIVTSTDYSNFFAQRCSPLAQPEIREAADRMREALADSTPADTDWDQWHIPYVGDDPETLDALAGKVDAPAPWDTACKVSAARCARVSYLTHDGTRDPQVDLDLYDRLATADPPHWSPMEHVARPARPDEPTRGNLDRWVQMRHEVTRRG